MAIRLSSQAAQALATRYGLASMLAGGHICLYSGAQPADADEEPAGELLAIVTANGKPIATTASREGGLAFQSGYQYGEVVDVGDWQAVCVKAGAVGWWRAVAFGHLPTGSGTMHARIDGAVGESLDLGGLSSLAVGQKAQVIFAARMLRA